MSKLTNYILGPRILQKFTPGTAEDEIYEENSLEALGERMMMFGRGFRHFCTVISPILFSMAYNRGWFAPSCMTKFVQYAVIYYSFAYTCRTIGRVCNGDYRTFANLLIEVTESKEPSPAAERELRKYDYEIFMAPVAFTATPRDDKKVVAVDETEFEDYGPLWTTIRDPLCAAVVHTFGRRMLYPGATSIFKTLLQGPLCQGRKNLVIENGGKRNVIITEDGNRIDTMFVDNRNPSKRFGAKLVITSEGNAGYYEVGIMNNGPISRGYSVLGWNHPGFGQSSGLPYPDQEMNAMDAVMQFATKKLGFKESDIILYGWSIGGYASTWAAANYDVGSVVLDATFDDVVPLAISKMPSPISFVVHYALRTHLNLQISKQLAMYKGPVRLIRRTHDEIMITNESGTDVEQLASNRANQLLLDLIDARHPGLLRNENDRGLVRMWLSLNAISRISQSSENIGELKRYAIYSGLNDKQRSSLIRYFCDKYLVDYDAGHNVPLPAEYFNPPTA
ncbi:hypothetical protein L596_018155 [Steinernema carpocapsae]|uniref:AB hydrolase-1 domain-containing protein n=1 Tax=Steinernema carpocapsae TaxID=34508 RepID=A0A4U5N426_STECR|nr:hypothetical protein L596_018155 [Steinernema carpocapsae]